MQQTKTNSIYLPNVILPNDVQYTDDLSVAVTDTDIVFIVTPSHGVREISARISKLIAREAILVTASKGLEIGSMKRMSEIVAEEVPLLCDRIAVLSGPNHAEEVGSKQPSATVVASSSRLIAETVQDILMRPYFRVYTNPDVIGVELGGALKNIIALGAGIAEGMGLGDNAKAALITRGLAEIARLGMAMQANPLTFAGLAGIGDLMVTCASRYSRNRRAGIMLAQGKTIKQIESETSMVVEGIRSTYAAYHLAKKLAVEMPITEQTYMVLYQEKSPTDAVSELMTRVRTHEVEEVVLENEWEKW
jgi:glycerol-3-phosphate dehydrogenase (NAD(P)+)